MARSPRPERSVAALNDRPMSLCISWDRLAVRPESRSLLRRDDVARGSMSYSAVTHPLPRPRIQRGTSSSTEAAHSTAVFPISISAEPSAACWQPVVMRMSRSWSGMRPSWRTRDWLMLMASFFGMADSVTDV